MCGLVGDGALQDAVRGVEGQPEAEEVGEQQNPGEREMGEVDEEGEDGGEDGEMKVFADEDGVVGEERWVEGELDAGDVEAAVLGEGMVAMHEQDEEREHGEKKKPARARPG